MRVLASGLMRFGDRKATVMECSDGRFLVLVESLVGVEESCVEWLSGEDCSEWLRCLRGCKVVRAFLCVWLWLCCENGAERGSSV